MINSVDQDIQQKLGELEVKLEETRLAVLTIKKIFVWTIVITVVTIVLPLIGLLFVIPQIFSAYQGMGGF